MSKNNLEVVNKRENINDSLDLKIRELSEKDFYSYAKKEDGSYRALVNGIELDIKVSSQEKLFQLLQFVSYLINFYFKLEKKGKLYVGKGKLTELFGLKNKFDIYVDNRSGLNERIHFGDTIFLSGESIEKTFGLKQAGEMKEAEINKIVDFLNQVLEVE